MAALANAKTVEVNSSHVPTISQPLKVISLVLDASK